MPAVWDRVDAELTRRNWTWAQLGRKINATDQRINNWKHRDIPAKEYLAVASALGWSVDQLLSERVSDSESEDHPAAEGSGLPALAQQLIHPEPIMVPRTIDWESLMSEPLPPFFRAVLPDDAMGIDYPKGAVVNFTTTELPARARDLVLVADADGDVHFREFQQGRGDKWQAVALVSGYAPLDSESDGLRVLAISMGRWGRRG